MKNICLAALLLLGYALASSAQDATVANPSPTTSIFIARTGIRTDTPHVGTYHYVEFFQLRGNWIYPDIGEIDFARSDYYELFAGFGHTLYNGKKAMVAEELYFVQTAGSASQSARYLQPWTLVDIRFTPKLTSEIVYFPYVPLNQTARVQHVLERAKAEYAVSKHWKIGGGYAGYQYGNNEWQSKPLITTTISTKAGAFEFWFQKMPDGAQIQVRYALVHP